MKQKDNSMAVWSSDRTVFFYFKKFAKAYKYLL